jgi:hypothetical protein
MRALRWLAIVTLAAVAAAAAARWMDQAAVERAFAPARLFPALKGQLGEVAGLTIETKERSFNLARMADGKWVLPGKGNFAANRDLVQSTLIALAETDLIERRTARADWHRLLDLSLPKDGGAGSILTLTNAKGEKIASVIVGKGVEGANAGDRFAAYVRRPGEDQTYVALGKLRLQAKETDWLDKRFLDFDRTRIREAAIRPAQGGAYVVSRAKAEDENFTLQTPLPRGATLRTEREPNGVGQALFNLTFEDVADAKSLDFSTATFAGFKAFNGLSLSFAVLKKGEDYWATVNATAEDQPPPAPKAGQKPPVLASVEAKAINARAAGWAFKLPQYKGVLMTAPLQDLLKAPEAPAGPEVNPPPLPGAAPPPRPRRRGR